MNKKIIGLVACILITTMGAFPALAATEAQDFEKYANVIEKKAQGIGDNYLFVSMGPARLRSKFTFINGSQDEIQKIENLLKFSIFKPAIKTVWVTNLTFSLAYSSNIFRLRSRFWYNTNVTEYNESGSITNTSNFYNSPHSIKVYNFTGYFHLIKPKFFRLLSLGPKFFRPARYTMAGYAEDVEFLQMPL